MSQTITLTPEQASAFERGESITLEPPKPPKRRYIVVTGVGNVYDVLSDGPCGRYDSAIVGDCKLIAKGLTSQHTGVPGEHSQGSVSTDFLSVTEVQR